MNWKWIVRNERPSDYVKAVLIGLSVGALIAPMVWAGEALPPPPGSGGGGHGTPPPHFWGNGMSITGRAKFPDTGGPFGGGVTWTVIYLPPFTPTPVVIP